MKRQVSLPSILFWLQWGGVVLGLGAPALSLYIWLSDYERAIELRSELFLMAPFSAVLVLALSLGFPISLAPRWGRRFSQWLSCILAALSFLFIVDLFIHKLAGSDWISRSLIDQLAHRIFGPATPNASFFTTSLLAATSISFFIIHSAGLHSASLRCFAKLIAVGGALFGLLVCMAFSAGIPMVNEGGHLTMSWLSAVGILGVNFGLVCRATIDSLDRLAVQTAGDSAHSQSLHSFEGRLMLVVALFSLGLFTCGFFYLKERKASHSEAFIESLETVAGLKLHQVSNWIEARRNESLFASKSDAFSRDISAYLSNQNDESKRLAVLQWIEVFKENPIYSSVVFRDAKLRVRLSIEDEAQTADPILESSLPDALCKVGPSIVDLHNDSLGRPFMHFLVPVFAPAKHRSVQAPSAGSSPAPLGILVFAIDPRRHVYPLIQAWPMPGASAETLIGKREGPEVVYLSPPRLGNYKAVLLRRSLSEADLPMAMAARGDYGIQQGRDYRGVSVLCSINSLPNHPWFVITKIDVSEVYASLRREAWMVALAISSLLVAAAFAAGLVWRQDAATFLVEELELRRQQASSQEALRESEARYRRLIHAVTDYVYSVVIRKGKAVETSHGQGCHAVTGYSPEELVANSRLWIDMIVLEDQPLVLAQIADIMDNKDAAAVEHRIKRKDGKIRWVRNTPSSHRDAAGVLLGYDGIIQDITDRKTLELNLESLVKARTAELEAINRELEAFSYSVSHDLRAPLRGVDGFARILQEEYAKVLDPEGQRLLGIVVSETQRMGRLIDDLLAFSRLGRRALQFEEVDIQALAQEVRDELLAREPGRNISWTIDTTPKAKADPAFMRQVLVNLMGNAMKYTRKKAAARIEIGAEIKGGEIVYFVRDNGAGFDMNFSHRLFGVFQRLHNDADFEGNGIGLALVQRIIHFHGGRVWAEGRVGEGATFHFTLPSTRR